MAERVTVEVGGMSSGVYHFVRVTDYDVSETEVEDDARDAFEDAHGSPGNFGNFGTTGIATDEVPTYEAVWVEVGGYMRGGKPVRGAPSRRYRRVYYDRKVTPGTDTKRDTRGGRSRPKRRGAWRR